MKETVVFLNTFLRSPSFLFWDKQKERTSRIIPFIKRKVGKKPSIIGLAEVFKGYCEKMGKEAKKHNYNYICPGGGLIQSSGLMFLYDPRIWDVDFYIKEKFEKCTGSDCFAQKGFITFKMFHKKTKKYVYFIITHLNANQTKNKKTDDIQFSQLKQIQSLIKEEIPKNSPLVVMGDFNIDIDESPLPLVNKIRTFGNIGNPQNYTTNNWSQEGLEILDYIITKNIRTNNTQVFNYNKSNPLSDHNVISRNINI